MCAVAYDPDVLFDYVLAADRDKPPEKQTIFHLKTLTARDTEAIENAWRTMMSGDKDKVAEKDLVLALNRGTMTIETLKRGLCGWDNFLDARGKPIPFLPCERAICPMKNIDRLQPDDRHELAKAIEDGAHLSESDRKN